MFNIITLAFSPAEIVEGVMVNDTPVTLEEFTSIKGVAYFWADLWPIAELLAQSGVAFKETIKGSVIKVGKLKLISLLRWRLLDGLTQEVLSELLAEFGDRGEIPASPGVALAWKIKREVNSSGIIPIHEKEARWASRRLKGSYIPAYRAGIVARTAEKGKFIKKVTSYDISSAYPAALVAEEFPCTESVERDASDYSVNSLGFMEGIFPGEGFLAMVTFRGLKRNAGVTISPLSSYEEERFYRGAEFDSIGVVTAEEVTIAVSYPELIAMGLTYTWASSEVLEIFTHFLSKLEEPKGFIEKLFKAKGQKKVWAKIAVNSLSGTIGRNPISDIRGEVNDSSISRAVTQYNLPEGRARVMGAPRRLDLRVAIYMNSWVRLRLVIMGIKTAGIKGARVAYCDTDSIKFEGFSANIQEVFSESSASYEKLTGIPGLGAWKDESDDYAGGAIFLERRFYAREANGQIEAVFAGLSKEKSSTVLNRLYPQGLKSVGDGPLVGVEERWGTVEDPEVTVWGATSSPVIDIQIREIS